MANCWAARNRGCWASTAPRSVRHRRVREPSTDRAAITRRVALLRGACHPTQPPLTQDACTAVGDGDALTPAVNACEASE